MNKAENITNGNVNMNCNYCGGCGYHKLSCPAQKATIFLPKIDKLRIEKRKMRYAKGAETNVKPNKDVEP